MLEQVFAPLEVTGHWGSLGGPAHIYKSGIKIGCYHLNTVCSDSAIGSFHCICSPHEGLLLSSFLEAAVQSSFITILDAESKKHKKDKVSVWFLLCFLTAQPPTLSPHSEPPHASEQGYEHFLLPIQSNSFSTCTSPTKY